MYKIAMKKLIYSSALFLLLTLQVNSQSYYYPPGGNQTWDTTDVNTLGWCLNYLDTVHDYLNQSNTKGFIILKDGKIVDEIYFGTFTKDSIWYWASAGKTITSFLVGVAQHEGFLSIDDTSSNYLGNGWTNCTTAQEEKITIRNQLAMTSGLDDGVPNNDCTQPSCLIYKADAGTRWSYHNAPYRLLQNVVQQASGVSFQQYTNQKIAAPIGMSGLWYDSIYYSTTRSMAKFGSLILRKGIWNLDTLMRDTSYFNQMTNTSQQINKSYGYLWWLNGKGSYMAPTVQFVIPTDLIPTAPSDLIAALGKNDQKIYVIPSQNMVIVRMGNASGAPTLALSSFDNILWSKLSQLFCTSIGIQEKSETSITISPNPALDYLYISKESKISIQAEIFNLEGKLIFEEIVNDEKISLDALNQGIHILVLKDQFGHILTRHKFIKL